MSEGLFSFHPHKGVGRIEVGKPLFKALIHDYKLIRIPDEENENVGWSVLGTKTGTFRVYLENNLVTSIGCYSHCYFKGKNLIGLPLSEVLRLFEAGIDTKSIEEFQIGDDVQASFDLGDDVQIWVKEQCVVSVILG